MHTKYYTFILLFFLYPVFGQIRLEFSYINSIANVTIYNESEENYILPLDINHFRPYEDGCDSFSDHEPEFPSLGLMVNIIRSNDIREDYVVGYYKTSGSFDALSKKINKKKSVFQKEIKDWGRRNNIKDHNLSLINYKIMNNLVYLEPKAKMSFNIKLDLFNITEQEFIFYNYILEKSENYKIYLSLCQATEIDKYLTFSQKNKLKKYKFFTKNIESNFIEFKQ